MVPIYAAVSWPNLDWMNYLTIWEGLPADIKRVGELIGVEERFLVRAMRGTVNNQTQKQVSQSLECYSFISKNYEPSLYRFGKWPYTRGFTRPSPSTTLSMKLP